jgi:Bacterial SH3 domain
MRRSLAWLWLIGAVVYVVATWHFVEIETPRRKDPTGPGPTASAVVAANQLTILTQPIGPLDMPASAFSLDAPEGVDAFKNPDAPNQIPTTAPTERLVVKSAANIRNAPSSNSMLIGTAPVGAELEVAERSSGWVRFVDPSTSHTGWIHESLLVASGTEASAASDQSNTNSAATRVRNITRPGDKSKRSVNRPSLQAYDQGPSPEANRPTKPRFGLFARRRMLKEGWAADGLQMR